MNVTVVVSLQQRQHILEQVSICLDTEIQVLLRNYVANFHRLNYAVVSVTANSVEVTYCRAFTVCNI